MTDEAPIRALSGKPVDGLTLEAVRTGEVGVADLRIHPETLERQAVVAEQHGNPQLAGNLRRAAELTRLPDDEVLAIYEALRPGRSTPAQLTELAASLDTRGLPRCAALLTEAADVYARLLGENDHLFESPVAVEIDAIGHDDESLLLQANRLEHLDALGGEVRGGAGALERT